MSNDYSVELVVYFGSMPVCCQDPDTEVTPSVIDACIFQDKNFSLGFMVVGMPNVGKSSLINALRRNYLKKGELCGGFRGF